MTKDERGDQGISCWLKNNGIGTLWYTMQFGKTFVGIKVCKRALFKNPDVVIFIVVPSIIVYNNWIQYIKVHIGDAPTIHVITKNELLNITDIECSILIIDEIHKITTDKTYTAILKIRTKYVLGLTGTYPAGEDKRKLDKIAPVVDIITSEEAVANDWITPFEEFNYLIEFPDEDKARYVKYTEPISETLQLFKGTAKELNTFMRNDIFKSDYQVIDGCFRGQVIYTMKGPIRFPGSDYRVILSQLKGWRQDMPLDNDLNKQINAYWNPMAIEERVKAFDKQIRFRNKLMITHPLKLEKVKEIILKFFKPTIIFNESTDFADMVCNAINRLGDEKRPMCTVYHSNVESRAIRDDRGDIIVYKTGERAGQPKMFGKTFLKEDAIDGFTSGRYLAISTARAMDEGLSVPNIEIVITTGGNTNPVSYQQRTARGKTVDIYNKDKKTLIVNIVFDNFYVNNFDEDGLSNSRLIKSRDLTKLIARQGEALDVNWVKTIDEINLSE